ncbi:hypothetical protein Halha_1878 [Halobacteroides halobius DSM 5150]|uniref:DUF4342 domain-containing protein n=1 Tax=Halobacteroides halobius (strain ATCC 35273 / DSM 5150 / MD-1) TaxID=748449 RepID=L0KBQ9_HALHC|nr:DUF4342 domain-containing protein [Halobacteroides halobius]AGB41789.1 hypothetical protein Halha_1878 [Halobacteroides halobius DSM 5150]
MEEINKLDVIVERTGVNYKKAVNALKAADGDVLEAVLAIDNDQESRQGKKEEQNRFNQQQKQQKQFKNEFQVRGEEVITKVKELIKKGNVTRINIKKDGRTVLNIPVTAGVIGVVLAPYLAALGAIAAVATKYKIKVERSK